MTASALPPACPHLTIPGGLVLGLLSETEKGQGEPLGSWEVKQGYKGLLAYGAFTWEEDMSEGV